MSDSFHLFDLRSQGAAVRRLLTGKSLQEKLDWLKERGTVTSRPPLPRGLHEIFWFESSEGLHATFFFDGDELIIVHEHSTSVAMDDPQ